MKNKWKMKVAILSILSVLLILNIRMNSKEFWKEKAFAYLENEYDGDFELLDLKKESDKYIFHFQTKDNNKITFTMKGWVDEYLSPWGKVPYTYKRYFLDDFPEQITNKFVDNAIVYDMTDKSTEEIVILCKSLSKKVRKYYDSYGLSWQLPEIIIKVKHNGKIAKVQYKKQNESILEDSLVRDFY